MRLGDVFRLSSGKSLPEKKRVSGNYSVYGGNGITGYHNEFFIKEPTIVIGRVGEYCGSVHLTSDNCWVTDNALMVTDWYIDVDKEYLVYALKFLNIHQYAKISGQPSISQGNIYDLNIEMPSKEHQKEIVAILKKTESLIQYRYKQIFQLDNLIKARFVEMFGNPLDKSRVNYSFTDCVFFNPKKSELKDLNVEVSFVPMEYVGVDGSFSIKESGKASEYYKGYTYFRNGDVLLAKITPCFENGKVAIAEGCENEIGFGTTEFHVSRPKKGITNSYWIKYLLKNDFVHELAKLNMTGSAGQKRIQTQFFEKLKIYVPPIDQQIDFEAFVKQVDKSKVAVQKALDETQMLFDSLMQKYFG